MRILGPIVGAMTAVMFCGETWSFERRRIGPWFVGHDPAWCKTLHLEQLLHQLLDRLRITSVLHEEVQNFAFIVDSSPKPIAFLPDDRDHFIKVPVITGPGTRAAEV